MLRNCDIVILSSSRWDDSFSSSALCLAKQFALHNRVFFIDHPFSIKDYFSKENKHRIKDRKDALLWGKNPSVKIAGMPDRFRAVTARLTLPVNWLGKGRFYNLLSAINDKVLHATLRKVIREHQISQYIFINIFDPYFFRTIPRSIAPKLSVYYTVDDISQETYIARHGVRLEKEAMLKASFSLATSTELTKLASKFCSNMFYLPNAADTSLFATAVHQRFEKPPELQNNTRKVICYTGNIGTRINYELLKQVAQFHHDKLLLLIGPASTGDYKKTGLDTLPNVLFTGAKQIQQLPAYLQHVHCAIIPFEYSLLTKSIYPLKINEYLAAGKPVISTAFSADIDDFKDVAYIAVENKDFVEMIDLALDEDNIVRREKRMRKASENTWQARVESFWQIAEAQAAGEDQSQPAKKALKAI